MPANLAEYIPVHMLPDEYLADEQKGAGPMKSIVGMYHYQPYIWGIERGLSYLMVHHSQAP